MRRFALMAGMCALVLASACSDRSTAPTTVPATPRLSIDPPGQSACVVLSEAQIVALIDAVFENGSPDEQSALGKWDNITKQRAAGDREAVVKEKILDLVDFILEKNTQGKLAASDNALRQLVNALFCYAGLADDYYYPGGGGDLIYPTDDAKIVYEANGLAAMSLPANAVFSPTLVTITRTSTPLNTKLDKYPATFEFSKYPADEPFAKFVITEVCAVTPDQETFDALVLGHNKANGSFELLPEPTGYASVLTRCSTLTASAPTVGERLLAMVLPRTLYAAAMLGGGGVAGSVLELSPIGPVDPRINVSKIGGNSSAPIGSLVSPAPGVRLTTPQGANLDGITVLFAAGATSATGATISPASRSSLATPDSAGMATTAWRLGTLTSPAFVLQVTPQIGGIVAVPGVDFIPDAQQFEASALPASGLVITQTPATDTAGATLGALTAKVVDTQGRAVEGFAGSVSLTAAPGPIYSGTTTRTVTAGSVSFTDLVFRKAGVQTLTLVTSPGAFTASMQITIAKGSPRISKVSGDNLTITLPGSVTPVVKVADQFDNRYAGVTVYWRQFDGSTPSPVSSSTAADGTTSTTWTLEQDVNKLFASLDATAFVDGRWVEFTAFGTPPRSGGEALLACAVGNNRVPIDDNNVRLVPPSGNKAYFRVDELKLYFSVTGDANPNTLKLYPLQISAYETLNGVTTLARTATATAALRGNASQNDGGANFLFSGGYRPTTGSVVTFVVRNTAPVKDGAVRVNTGNCSNAGAITVVGGALPINPTAAVVKTSVAIQVYGAK